MDRHDYIRNHRYVLLFGNMVMTRGMYEVLYEELIGTATPEDCSWREEHGFEVYPTWEEIIIKLSPWAASDEDFALWQAGTYWNDKGSSRRGSYGALVR